MLKKYAIVAFLVGFSSIASARDLRTPSDSDLQAGNRECNSDMGSLAARGQFLAIEQNQTEEDLNAANRTVTTLDEKLKASEKALADEQAKSKKLASDLDQARKKIDEADKATRPPPN
jgi:uncharacterized phage infection (PIP) family protein YhgE